MAPLLRVKNWEQFQHYAGTRAETSMPWLKLYRGLLQDFDFLKLNDIQRWHLIGIWLLAGGNNPRGSVIDDAAFIKNRLGSTHKVDLNALVSTGFLVRDLDASSNDDAAARDAASSRRGEERREEEKREEEKYLSDFEAAWADYPPRPHNAKKPAYKAWQARIAAGIEPHRLHNAVKGYKRAVLLAGTRPEFVLQGSTFFGPNERWLAYERDQQPDAQSDLIDLYDPITGDVTEYGRALGL